MPQFNETTRTVKISISATEEEWRQCPDVHCMKCGQQTAWMEISWWNYEDNAGDYYLCTSCYHDWHAYPLDGENGTERTRKRAELLSAALRPGH